jgi:hypothetical protein
MMTTETQAVSYDDFLCWIYNILPVHFTRALRHELERKESEEDAGHFLYRTMPVNVKHLLLDEFLAHGERVDELQKAHSGDLFLSAGEGMVIPETDDERAINQMQREAVAQILADWIEPAASDVQKLQFAWRVSRGR